MRLILSLLFACLVLTRPASAVTPNEQLANPALEARAVRISQELRCVVCQNQTIDDSNATLAHDLRVILRERLSAGDTDQQAIAFIVRRYGHHVLLRPPLEYETLVLWFGPLGVLILGGVATGVYFRTRVQAMKASPAAFNAQEEADLDRLLGPSEQA